MKVYWLAFSKSRVLRLGLFQKLGIFNCDFSKTRVFRLGICKKLGLRLGITQKSRVIECNLGISSLNWE